MCLQIDALDKCKTNTDLVGYMPVIFIDDKICKNYYTDVIYEYFKLYKVDELKTEQYRGHLWCTNGFKIFNCNLLELGTIIAHNENMGIVNVIVPKGTLYYLNGLDVIVSQMIILK